MANDPNTIQYVIQEDGFWYIASKEKNPYVPQLTVSAKGVANGLSTEYNDGYDFGPDSYNPSVTSGVPLTQTSGIQEAINYAYSIASYISAPPDSVPSILTPAIKLGIGAFNINAPVTLPAPGFSVAVGPTWYISGSGIQNSVLNINVNGEYGITMSPDNAYGMFQFSDFSVNTLPGYTPNGWLNMDLSGTNSGRDNCILSRINIYEGSEVWAVNSMRIIGLVQIRLIDIWDTSYHNGYSNGPYIVDSTISWDGGVSYSPIVISFTTESSSAFTAHFSNMQTLPIQVLNGIQTLSIDNCFFVSITLNGTGQIIDTLSISNCSFNNVSSPTPGQFTSVIAPIGTMTATILKLILINNTFYLSATLPLLGTGITADYIVEHANYYSHGTNVLTFPNTTVTGTTAGSFIANMINQDSMYKKVLIYLDGYENDSTTAQTYTYPVAFTTVAEITSNTASVPVVSTSLTEFSIAPDTTTAYTGIIVIEGY